MFIVSPNRTIIYLGLVTPEPPDLQSKKPVPNRDGFNPRYHPD